MLVSHKPPARIVFLDFDGVLNSVAWDKSFAEADRPRHSARLDTAPVDPMAVRRLARLVRYMSAQIVVSSSWRYMYELAELGEILDTHAPGLSAVLIGRTPKTSEVAFDEYCGPQRGHEIQLWLEWYGHVHNVAAIVILDDSSDMVHLSPYLVKIDGGVGLTNHDVECAIEILDREQDLSLNASKARTA